MKTSGFGNYTREVIDGILILRQYSDAAMERVKKEGSSESFLLSANYRIDNGVLLISGEFTETKGLGGGNYHLYDKEVTQEEISEIKSGVYIGDDRFYTREIKKWWKVIGHQDMVKRGDYLSKKGTSVTYKTSAFRIIELS